MRFLESLAGWAWETSLAASVLIAIVFVFRLALRKSAPPALMHLLGLVILARLLLPSAPQSPASVFNLVEQPVPKMAPLAVSIPVITIAEPLPALSPKRSISVREYLPMIWALGGLIILGRVLQQHWRVRRWVKKGTTITNEVLVEARKLSGLKRAPLLKIVPEVKVPALLGYFRPVILLPSTYAEKGDLRLIFLHELAHVRRRHVLVNWVIILAQTLHWFNPLVWLAMRRLRADQEILCDQDVMRLIGADETQSYGETLLALASNTARPLPTILPISTNFKQMKERIRMITQFKPVTKRLVILGTLLAMTLSVVTFTRAVDTKAPTAPPNEPLKKRSANEERERTEVRLNSLRNEMERLTVQIEDREEQLAKVREMIPNLQVLEGGESDAVKSFEKDRIVADGEYVKIRRLYESLKNMKRSDLRGAIPTAWHDQNLDQYLSDFGKAQQQLAVVSKDYSEDHPEVQRLAALLKTVDKQIESRIDGVIAGLAVTTEVKKDVMEMISKRIEEVKSRDSESLSHARRYFRLKRDLETMQKVRDGLHMRVLQEEIESRIPKD